VDIKGQGLGHVSISHGAAVDITPIITATPFLGGGMETPQVFRPDVHATPEQYQVFISLHLILSLCMWNLQACPKVSAILA
jgi:hypothetical protein